jgi:radical SAM protein with 4Fe4S-binding SPASM domain
MKFHKPPFKLRAFKIEVTHKCNLYCVHCSSDGSPFSNIFMRKEDCLRILKEAIEMGVEEVAFSGGEPLLWPHLEDAIKVAKEGGMRVSIYTSGNVSDVISKLSMVKRLDVDRCIYSIFASFQEKHEEITRKPGSFIATLNAVSWSTKIGLATEFHFVPFSENFMEIERISKLSCDLGVNRISILRFVPHGRGREQKSYILNSSQNLELRKTVIALRENGYDIRTGSPYNILMLNDQPKCCAGIDRMIIGPDLKIFPCDAFKQIRADNIVGTINLSTLYGSTLSECWEKFPFLNAVRRYLTTEFAEPCTSCRFLENYLSGCLAQKVILHNDFGKRPDPLCLGNEMDISQLPFGKHPHSGRH